MEKDWPKRASDQKLQDTQNKTLIGPQLLRWMQSVFPRTRSCQGPHKPSSSATFTPSSHGGRAATDKRTLGSAHAGLLQLCPTLCDPVDCGLLGFSVREGVSPGKNPGMFWPILAAIPF